jgi:hypothetical protein
MNQGGMWRIGTFVLMTGVLLMLLTSTGSAQTTKQSSEQSSDAIVGTWKLNVAKSTYSPGPAPKGGTITYSPAGKGIKVVVDVAAATGEKVHWEYTADYDGKDYPVTGNPNADTVSLKRIDARTVDVINKKDGKPTLTNRRVLSADGKTLTVTTTGTNARGQTVKDVQVFEKA